MEQNSSTFVLILIIALLLIALIYLNVKLISLTQKVDLIGGLALSLVDLISIHNVIHKETIYVVKNIAECVKEDYDVDDKEQMEWLDKIEDLTKKIQSVIQS